MSTVPSGERGQHIPNDGPDHKDQAAILADELSRIQTVDEGATTSEQSHQGPENTGALEQILGLAQDVRFEDAIADRLRAEANSPHTEGRRQAILEAHGIDIDPVIAPDHSGLQELTGEDWEAVRTSEAPLLTLFAADNYRSLDWKTKDVASRYGGRRDPREGFEGLAARAEVESAPLIHGLTATAFVELDRTGVMHSNKTRYEKSGADPLAFHTDRPGMTLLSDREVGLDKQIFFDYARPAMNHRTQPEVTLVVDPAVMDTPGTFMTEKDIADTTSAGQYMNGLTTPEYFRETALLRIASTVTEVGESRDGGAHKGWKQYNDVNQFLNGQDGDPVNGKPTFSTYEVKIPDPPGVAVEAIRRVIVRDQATFEQLQSTMGDRYEFVHEPHLEPAGGIDETYDGDMRDAGARKPGNYDILSIPGAFEQKMETFIDAGYQDRLRTLAALPDDEKEQVIVVFGGTDASEINGSDPRTRVDAKTDPYLSGDSVVAIYPSMDSLRDDVAILPSRNDMFGASAADQPIWFADPLTRRRGLQTQSQTCVLATAERSKQNPHITRILNARSFSLDELSSESEPSGRDATGLDGHGAELNATQPETDSMDVTARNLELEHTLDPTQRLPQADVYPILGAAYGLADLGTKYPAGGLLPVAEAAQQERPYIDLVLGVDGKIATYMTLKVEKDLSDSVLTLSDVRLGMNPYGGPDPRWQNQGYGKKAHLALLQALPPGVEVTSSHRLSDDGRRMWEWLVTNGVAKKQDDYVPQPENAPAPGEFITQVNSLQSVQAHDDTL